MGANKGYHVTLHFPRFVLVPDGYSNRTVEIEGPIARWSLLFLVKLSVSGVACRAEKGLFVGVFVAGLKQGQKFSTIEYSEFTGVVFQDPLACQSFQSTVEGVALHAEERA